MTHRPAPDPPLLELRGITKRFGTVTANASIDLTIHQGETHAILGENGAGKSTLMKVIFGVLQPDAGKILWKDRPVRMTNPGQARALGMGMVFQHFSLFETASVVENISLTVPAPLPKLTERIRAKSAEFGLPVNPEALVHGLSVGERQRVEIIRCLLQEPDLLILDEPTSVLPPPAVQQLFATLRKLSETGIAILYISHKLNEIRALCDRATILRQGQVTGIADPATATAEDLAKLMIGRDIPHATHSAAHQDGTARLVINALSHTDRAPNAVGVKDLHLSLRSGEILGIAGVSGNGQAALARLISGEDVLPRDQSGRIQIMGKPAGHLAPEARRDMGLSFVPEERLGRGAAPPMSLADNGLLTGHLLGLVKHGLIRRRKRDAFAKGCIQAMDVRTSGPEAVASSLSGGNLQKYIVAREMALQPQLMVVSQPTWGIDVGAAALVRQRLIDLRDTGAAILVISEELEELFEISDRIAVMYDGRLSTPLSTRDTNAEAIGQMMIGQHAVHAEAAE